MLPLLARRVDVNQCMCCRRSLLVQPWGISPPAWLRERGVAWLFATYKPRRSFASALNHHSLDTQSDFSLLIQVY